MEDKKIRHKAFSVSIGSRHLRRGAGLRQQVVRDLARVLAYLEVCARIMLAFLLTQSSHAARAWARAGLAKKFCDVVPYSTDLATGVRWS